MEAAAGVQEAGGCSEPLKWEASELWEEVDLSGRELAEREGAVVGVVSDKGMAEREGAAAGVAWGLGTG